MSTGKSETNPNSRTIFSWTDQDITRYLNYLENNVTQHGTWRTRRPKYFYTKMSEHVGTHHSSESCRAYHESFLRKFSTVQEIIAHLRQKLTAPSKRKQGKRSDKREGKIVVKVSRPPEESEEQPPMNLKPFKEEFANFLDYNLEANGDYLRGMFHQERAELDKEYNFFVRNGEVFFMI